MKLKRNTAASSRADEEDRRKLRSKTWFPWSLHTTVDNNRSGLLRNCRYLSERSHPGHRGALPKGQRIPIFLMRASSHQLPGRNGNMLTFSRIFLPRRTDGGIARAMLSANRAQEGVWGERGEREKRGSTTGTGVTNKHNDVPVGLLR